MTRSLPLLFLLSAGAAALAAEWPGWRGLDRQGPAQADGPVQWSPTRNVAWSTPIPGRGHSSPVVAGGQAFLTTAYPSGKGRLLKRAAAWLALALAVLLPLLAAPHVLRACRAERPLRRRGLAALALTCALMGLLIHYVVAAELRLGGEPSGLEQQMERWLFTGRLLVVGLTLAAASAAGTRRARVLLGVLSLLAAALLAFGRPAPGYHALSGPGEHVRPLQLTVALPAILGLGLLLLACVRRGGSAAEAPAGRLQGSRVALAAAAFLAGLAAFAFPAMLALHWQLKRGTAGALPYRWTVLPTGPSSVYAAAACVGALLLVELAGWRRGLRFPRWVAALALLAAGLAFVEKNVLGVSEDAVRAVVCVDVATGTVRWTREGLEGPQRIVNVRNSPATPTPLVVGDRVVAWFGSAGCLCTDLDGRVLWTNTALPYDGVHGVAASPVLAAGRIILFSGQPTAPYLTALDPQTGRRAWTTRFRPWPGREGQHRTPTVGTLRGREVLLVWMWDGAEREDALRVLDAATGKLLWRYPVPTHREQVCSVLAEGDVAYLVHTRRATALSLARLARGEPPVLWTADLDGKGPYTSSPVLAAGMLFTVSPRGHATCLDARTGQRLWQERLVGGEHLASLVAAGDRVYFPARGGLTTVVAAARTFRALAENRLPGPLFATPAPVDGRLLLRGGGRLWCVGE